MKADTPGTARPRPSPRDLIDEYGPAAYEAAQAEALKTKGRDHVAFIAKWLADPENATKLESKHSKRSKTGRKNPGSTKLLCDSCGLPHYIDAMVSQEGEARCVAQCASKQRGTNWEAEAREHSAAPGVHVVTQRGTGGTARTPSEEERLGESDPATLAEIARLEELGPTQGVPVLLGWYMFPGNAMYPKHQAALKAALARLIDDPEALPTPPGLTEPTPAAVAVAAYWEEQGSAQEASAP